MLDLMLRALGMATTLRIQTENHPISISLPAIASLSLDELC